MSTNQKNIPDFLDRVYYNRKDGIVIAFDEAELCIEFDDGNREWVRMDKVRLTRRARDWAYFPDGSPIPYAQQFLSNIERTDENE